MVGNDRAEETSGLGFWVYNMKSTIEALAYYYQSYCHKETYEMCWERAAKKYLRSKPYRKILIEQISKPGYQITEFEEKLLGVLIKNG